jgi:hypothetical protein
MSQEHWELLWKVLGIVGPIISGGAALVAVFAGLRRSRRLLIAPMRLEWNTQLRDGISELISVNRNLNLESVFHGDPKLLGEAREKNLFLEYKIRLLLNPDEQSHESLANAVHRLNTESLTNGADQFNKLLEEVVALSQTVLRTEWKKIKALKI